MRCIGGPSHGRRVHVPDGAHYVNVVDPMQMHGPSFSAPMVGPAEVSITTATDYTRRTLRQVLPNGDVDEIQYLAPEGMRDLAALRSALT